MSTVTRAEAAAGGSRLALAVAALTALSAVALAPTPAEAASGRCSPGEGVTVVVDYGSLRSGVDLFCDRSGGGKTVYQIMAGAGVGWQNVANQPFVCRIQGLPGPDRESCTRTPPPDAYWGLFWAQGGGGWTYATRGASSQRVPDGGSVGWRWQNGGARDDPGAAPTPAASKPSPKPSPKPSSEPSPKPSPKPSAKPSSGAGSPSGAGGTPTSRPTSAPDGTATRSAAGGAAASGSPSTRRDRAASTSAERASDGQRRVRGGDARPGASDRDGRGRRQAAAAAPVEDSLEQEQPLVAQTDPAGGSTGDGWATTVAALVVLAALGAAGLLVARRRRA